jgi:hypothetical protein
VPVPLEAEMAAYVVDLHVRCTLCDASLLSVGRGGRVTASPEVHSVPVFRRSGTGAGIPLCDDCGMLAELRSGLTLN